jgi:hypothetical protein
MTMWDGGSYTPVGVRAKSMCTVSDTTIPALAGHRVWQPADAGTVRRQTYLIPAAAATSAAKSVSSFSMPSPSWKRT